MMVDLQTNPFVVLTLIVAPAVLTNAAAVLIMSTSNRFARAIDRARVLATRMDGLTDHRTAEFVRVRDELSYSRTRALLLLKAMRCFYLAMGAFALVALVSLLGAALASSGVPKASGVLVVFAVSAGATAVGGLVYGSSLLLRETRIVVSVMKRRIDELDELKGIGDEADKADKSR